MYDNEKQMVLQEAYGGMAAKHYVRERTPHNAIPRKNVVKSPVRGNHCPLI